MGVEDEDSFRLQRACGFRHIGKHLEDEEIDLEAEKPGLRS